MTKPIPIHLQLNQPDQFSVPPGLVDRKTNSLLSNPMKRHIGYLLLCACLSSVLQPAEAVTVQFTTTGLGPVIYFGGVPQESTLTLGGYANQSVDLTPDVPLDLITHDILIAAGTWVGVKDPDFDIWYPTPPIPDESQSLATVFTVNGISKTIDRVVHIQEIYNLQFQIDYPGGNPVTFDLGPLGLLDVTPFPGLAQFPGNSTSGFFLGSTFTLHQILTTSCPNPITQSNDPGQCSAVVNYPAPVASGGSGSVTVVCSPPSGSSFPVGINVVNCTATDSAGNTAACSFNVVVNDTEPPAPSVVTTAPAARNQNPARVVNRVQLFANDNCDADPLLFIGDSLSPDLVAGPFHQGDKVTLIRGLKFTPNSRKPLNPGIAGEILLNGDALIWATDSAGNVSPTQKY
jgi:hypothetical protein